MNVIQIHACPNHSLMSRKEKMEEKGPHEIFLMLNMWWNVHLEKQRGRILATQSFPPKEVQIKSLCSPEADGVKGRGTGHYTSQYKYSKLEGYSLVWQDSVRCKKIKAPTWLDFGCCL